MIAQKCPFGAKTFLENLIVFTLIPIKYHWYQANNYLKYS
jgi:hypothetical protein